MAELRNGGIAGLGIGVAGLAWWALWFEPRNVVLRRRHMEVGRWPSSLDGFTIAVMSDLHTGAPHVDLKRLGRLVRRVNRARPDLVALLGDYADPAVKLGERFEPPEVAERLGRLHSPLGSFAVLGNHDWVEHGAAMPAALRAVGITVLENAAVPAGRGLWIAGVADATTRRPRVEETVAAVPVGEPVILLSHDPDVFPEVPTRVAVTLAGHTHGGQVDIPVLRDRVTPSRHGAAYTGLVEEGGRKMWVSPGIGTSRWAIRFRARPEVTLLTLTGTSRS